MVKVRNHLLNRYATRVRPDKVRLTNGHRLVQLLEKRDGAKYETIVFVRVQKTALYQGQIRLIRGSIQNLGKGWKRVSGIIYFYGADQLRDSLLTQKKWTG